MIMKVEWESWDDYFELQIWVKMGLGGELSKLFYPWRLLVAGAGEEGGMSLLASNLLYDDHLNGLSGLVEPVTIAENLRVAFVYVTRPTTDHRILMMCNNYRKDNRAIAISLFGFQFDLVASGGDVGRIHGDDC
ncbi:hypothetical protein U1Q18_007894 [Sarracenia purpurea var. burkii]